MLDIRQVRLPKEVIGKGIKVFVNTGEEKSIVLNLLALQDKALQPRRKWQVLEELRHQLNLWVTCGYTLSTLNTYEIYL